MDEDSVLDFIVYSFETRKLLPETDRMKNVEL